MKPIEIFKVGKHTTTNGQTLPFDETMLSAAVKGYDPKLHEAPVVVGHPKDNHPAFGWIDHLELKDGTVLAHPKQIDSDFAELVEQGKYKKRSASWYLPDSPNNPKPGTLYLRHVGFLGAMPPAIKGLKDVQFSEQEQGVIEFGDLSPNFTEPQDKTMTPEQIAAMQAEIAALKAKEINFSESEKAIKQRELALAKRETSLQIEDFIKQGKVLPAQKAGLVEFMTSLDGDALTVEFGEGEQAKKLSPRQFMTDFLANMPKLVDFAEHSKADGAKKPQDLTAQEIEKKISACIKKQADLGNHISFSEAAALVEAGKDTE